MRCGTAATAAVGECAFMCCRCCSGSALSWWRRRVGRSASATAGAVAEAEPACCARTRWRDWFTRLLGDGRSSRRCFEWTLLTSFVGRCVESSSLCLTKGSAAWRESGGRHHPISRHSLTGCSCSCCSCSTATFDTRSICRVAQVALWRRSR